MRLVISSPLNSVCCLFSISTNTLLMTGTITGCPSARMHYNLFDTQITAKYGVVVDCWPLRTFCVPSALKTFNEVEVLFNAWRTGATKFRTLSDDELERWEADTLQVKLAVLNSDAAGEGDSDEPGGSSTIGPGCVDTAASETPSSLSQPIEAPETTTTTATTATTNGTKRSAGDSLQRVSKRKKTQDLDVTVGTTVDGQPLTVSKKPRKTRKDKGVKRAKKVTEVATTNDEGATTVPSSPSPAIPTVSTPPAVTPLPTAEATDPALTTHAVPSLLTTVSTSFPASPASPSFAITGSGTAPVSVHAANTPTPALQPIAIDPRLLSIP